MKVLKVNGVSVQVSDKEYMHYLSELNKKNNKTKVESKTLSIPAEPSAKSVSATYSDYVNRALQSGAELLYISDFVSVVAKGSTVIAEITAHIPKVYKGISYAIFQHGGKWCGDRDKKVFTYKFDREKGESFVASQKEYDQKKAR